MFFFFKQKTAYEVRISDWSADVCSSDLVLTSRAGPLRLSITALTGDEPLTPLTVEQIFKRPGQESSLQQSVAFLAYREKLLAGSWQYDTYFAIGRASCRERMCQYV